MGYFIEFFCGLGEIIVKFKILHLRWRNEKNPDWNSKIDYAIINSISKRINYANFNRSSSRQFYARVFKFCTE
jgi:hypothetical protein